MARTDIVLGSIDDAHMSRFVDGIAGHFGYRETIDGESNPETKAQYGKRKLKRQVITWIKEYERQVVEADEVDIT